MNFITLNFPNTATISLEGYNFNFTDNVFLSSSNSFPNITSFDYFSNSPFLSSLFPTISGFEYFKYNILNNNKLEVYVDSYSLPITGDYDIILKNRAGYFLLSLTNYVIRFLG